MLRLLKLLFQAAAAALKAEPKPIVIESTVPKDMSDRTAAYNVPFEEWCEKTGLVSGVPPRSLALATSWSPDSKYGRGVKEAMNSAERVFACDLLSEIQTQDVPGAIVEFGVFEGDWLQTLTNHCEAIGLKRTIWGFDSFEGLPAPKDGLDISGFRAGEYVADFNFVYRRLQCDKRDVRLVKGWFRDTLPTPQVQGIERIAFARIDCDLYEPAVECLDYLGQRLADGAVLVFDDWSWWFGHGEPRAFFEWAEKSGLRFEFLAYTSWIHLYLRVRRDSPEIS